MDTCGPTTTTRFRVPTLWMQGRAGWACRPICTASRPRLSCRSSRRRYLFCPARPKTTRTVADESACSRRGHCLTAWSPHVPTPSRRNLQSLVRHVDCPSCRGCTQLNSGTCRRPGPGTRAVTINSIALVNLKHNTIQEHFRPLLRKYECTPSSFSPLPAFPSLLPLDLDSVAWTGLDCGLTD